MLYKIETPAGDVASWDERSQMLIYKNVILSEVNSLNDATRTMWTVDNIVNLDKGPTCEEYRSTLKVTASVSS